jgi:hypothetical protein
MNGKVMKYSTFKPQTNPRNPTPWEVVKRFDGASDRHYNKFLKEYIGTPHVHDTNFPGGVRYPEPWENP